jgi:hypothetical protein
MARPQAKAQAGYRPIAESHHDAILSLIQPAPIQSKSKYRILDPWAGYGVFLEQAANAWHLTPYASEIDRERAQACIDRFGPLQALHTDFHVLRTPSAAYSIGWFNPPYDHDTSSQSNSKRLEFAYLRDAWRWMQPGGLVLWCVYQQHITEEAASFFAKHADDADVWALPGKDMGIYDQIIVVARVTRRMGDNAQLYQKILQEKFSPRILEMQTEPVYTLPEPPALKRGGFYFTADVVQPEHVQALLAGQGAHLTTAFQDLLRPPIKIEQRQDIVPQRPGHIALTLTARIQDGLVIHTHEHGPVAMQSRIQTVESQGAVQVEGDPDNIEKRITKTTMRLTPKTTINLLTREGTHIELSGDQAILNFIKTNRDTLMAYLNQRFTALYQFDFNGLGPMLNRLRLNGRYELYLPQKHIVGAITKGFEHRDGILLVGQMGVGKTAIASSAIAALVSGLIHHLTPKMRQNEIIVLVAPPHLIPKWQRELQSILPRACIQHAKRHEDIKAFMQKADTLSSVTPKILLMKRDMTKLGASRVSAVRWIRKPTARWQRHEQPPMDNLTLPRVYRQELPTCPHCGAVVTYTHKGTVITASRSWLESHPMQTCDQCQQPLWQEDRSASEKPAPDEKFPPKNPRYSLVAYLQHCYADRIYLTIWDEIHEGKGGSTGNGASLQRLANMSKKVLGLTGTPFNGKASSMFYLEYALNPVVRQLYPIGGAARLSKKNPDNPRGFQSRTESEHSRGQTESRWVADMGVRESTIEERPEFNSETGVFTGVSTYQTPYSEAPGISPLLPALMNDHTVYFSLQDLHTHLPEYHEWAEAIDPDPDLADKYDQILDKLKQYLIDRKWEGDTSFRGAYLQWAMGWVNSCFREESVIHNRASFNGRKEPYPVATAPSLGVNRVYAKEQRLMELVEESLHDDKPVILYLRQTGKRDISDRIYQTIQRVPNARPFILKSTTMPEKREALIDKQIQTSGINVLITNAELVKTGLDLIHFKRIICYEPQFNLSTMLQANGRHYRLSQTAPLVETIHLYYTGTMEERAVKLMSRKQRAAKLLTGDAGLTGLDALTEGEGSIEDELASLVDDDSAILNPRDLFARAVDVTEKDINAADYAFWQVENPAVTSDPLINYAEEILNGIARPYMVPTAKPVEPKSAQPVNLLYFRIDHYLKQAALRDDTQYHDSLHTILGVLEKEILNPSPTDEPSEIPLIQTISDELKQHRLVFPSYESEVATELVTRARQVFAREPISDPVEQAAFQNADMHQEPSTTLHIVPKPDPQTRPKSRRVDLNALPDDESVTLLTLVPPRSAEEPARQQMKLFG